MVPPICSLRCFSRAVQDCTGEPGGITLHRCFSAAARWDILLRVINELVAGYAAMEQVSFWDKYIIGALCILDGSFDKRSHLSDTIFNVRTSDTISSFRIEPPYFKTCPAYWKGDSLN